MNSSFNSTSAADDVFVLPLIPLVDCSDSYVSSQEDESLSESSYAAAIPAGEDDYSGSYVEAMD